MARKTNYLVRKFPHEISLIIHYFQLAKWYDFECGILVVDSGRGNFLRTNCTLYNLV